MKYKTIKEPDLVELRNSIEHSNKKELSLNFDNYRKFLFLLKLYPTLKAVPTKTIDEIWHYHLSNEKLYSKDCISYFGHLIMHRQVRSEKDFSLQEKNYLLTNKLWALNFNGNLGEMSEMAFCGVDGDGGDGGDPGGDK